MTLSFTAIGENTVQHDFSCDLSSLEDALDILAIVVFQGHTLVQAHIIDEGGRLELPIEIVDGQPFSSTMKKLERQWKAVLKKPVRSSLLVHAQWKQDINQRRIRLYDKRLVYLNEVIGSLKQLCQEIDNGLYNDQRGCRLISRYASLISTYEQYIVQTNTERESVLKKLNPPK